MKGKVHWLASTLKLRPLQCQEVWILKEALPKHYGNGFIQLEKLEVGLKSIVLEI